MNVYVVGAGVSAQVGYPLGSALFSKIDSYIRAHGTFLDRADYAMEWPTLCEWLKCNRDPLVRGAYNSGNVENIFTVLDLARKLREEGRRCAARGRESWEDGADRAKADSESIDLETKEHQRYWPILRWALVKFFEKRHQDDLKGFETPGAGWQLL